MKPTLTFEKLELRIGEFGAESSVPAINEMANTQNVMKFELDEDDDIFAGYEQITNSFPYREYTQYNRSSKLKSTNVAILENDYLKATFLIDFGGRMWSLIDKTTDTNLLYTNDVIRPSNLSVRNAWFSGGVEWNMGVIGHSPFTSDPIFATSLENEEKNPVLRMYEFERIRKATYQMDFWLDKEDRYINCRMRIVNENDNITPMYWWSNMAVPEYEGGRVIVPAKRAYTYNNGTVCKVLLPVVNGIDVTKYKEINNSVDYFFDIADDKNRYITNINKDGYGLLQASTHRLKGRKLFSWGNNAGSDKWQEFLTEKAGRYIEIQAGLERTQYGCFPMQPHTAYEWLEVYGPISVSNKVVLAEFEDAVDMVDKIVHDNISFESLENKLLSTKGAIAKVESKSIYCGSGYGALENMYRKHSGKKILSENLDFGECSLEQQQWLKLLEYGYFDDVDENLPPQSFMADNDWFVLLEESMKSVNYFNWYALYQLGLMHFWKRNIDKSREYLNRSLELKNNCWSIHALAVLELSIGNKQSATVYAVKGITMRGFDLGYVKDCMKILLQADSYRELLNIFSCLNSDVAINGRIQLYKVEALYQLGEYMAAYSLLTENDSLKVDDIREGEKTIIQLWSSLSKELGIYDEEKGVPGNFNFSAN